MMQLNRPSRLIGMSVALFLIPITGSRGVAAGPRPFQAAPPERTEAGDDPKDPGDSEPAEEPDAHETAPAPPLRKLTVEEINRIRFMELRGMRLSKTHTPDRVTVKIPRDTIDAFLTMMEDHPDFHGQRSRRAFLKKTAPQKLHYIARFGGPDYADKVTITSDPEIFIEFQRTVLPTVLRSCATSACHISTHENAMGFRLFKDPKKTAASTYANFIVLNELSLGGHRVIERARPIESLLLTYMLPRREVRVPLRHPGEVDYKPVFQKTSARRFQRIKQWIAALKHPAEDYGVHLIEMPEEEDDESEGEAGELAGPRPPDRNTPSIHPDETIRIP
ncbi:MAG: hypothetical protein ACE5EC_02485 [Phycisphaerae bacterium]